LRVDRSVTLARTSAGDTGSTVTILTDGTDS
jgi:hypothetical protein